MDFNSDKDRLQDILEFGRSKSDAYLARVLNGLPPELFHEIVNVHFESIGAADVRTVGVEMLRELDRYPNPPDGCVSIDEITEGLERSARGARDMATLLFIYLHFNEIRLANKDFHGEDSAFDYVLTAHDFQSFV